MSKPNDELDELAFRLYAERIAKMPAQVNGEESSNWAYRKAQDFIVVRDRVRSGESPPAESRWSDASAPKLKPTHPHNLVSKRFVAEVHGGDAKALSLIKEIVKWLETHPQSDMHQVAYDRFDWDVPTTDLARIILPQYVNN